MARVLDQGAPADGGGFAFVGRQRELGLLLAAVRGPPAVVLVEGEAGIGKSRLTHEAAAILTGEGRPVLTGFCHPLREPFPYGPVVDALGRAGRWLPATGVPPTAGALAPLLPDLADRLPPPPPRPEGAEARRHQLLQAVHSFLTAVGPVVLVVEDLHWVDEATRELLLLLARDLPEQLGLVLTYRAEDLPPDTAVLGAPYRRPPGTNGAVIRLTPLSRREVQQLAVSALGRQATAELGAALFDRSEGLPLVAEEDLLTLREQGRQRPLADARAELEQAGVPSGLGEAVTERIAALTSAGAAIVDAAAVLAVPAQEPLLTRLAGLDAEEGARGLTEAVRAAVLRETAEGLYVFRHVLAQEAAYWRIPGPGRARLHRRAIEVLERQTPVPLVQIAHHAFAGGDRQGWFRRAEQAADQAVALGDTGTAAGLLHRILEQPNLEGDLRTRAALALARIVVNGVDHTRNVEVLRRILADPQLPLATRGEIRLGLGRLIANQGGDGAGYSELERCVQELAERPALAAQAMNVLALSERPSAAAQAAVWVERAERAAAASDDKGLRAAVRATRLTIMGRDGRPGVWRLVDRLPRESQDLEVLRQTTRGLYNTAESAVELGHDADAARLLAESRELVRSASIPFPKLECYSGIVLLRLEALAGRWADLERRFADFGARYPENAMFSMERALAFGRLDMARGQRARALDQFAAAAAAAERSFQVTVALRATAGMARVRLLQGAPRDAWAVAAPAVEVLRESEAWPRATGLVPVAVEAGLGCGEGRAAAQLVADAERVLADRDSPAAVAELDGARGLLAPAAEPARAAEHFERARLAWEAIGRPYDAAHAAERGGSALGARRPEEAAARLGAALETYTRLGATADVARCQQLLRDFGLGGPSARGRRGYGGQLSPRERQVAGMMATGATNHDIAEALFLSPRTVEQHVASALRKLGATRKSVGDALAHPQG